MKFQYILFTSYIMGKSSPATMAMMKIQGNPRESLMLALLCLPKKGPFFFFSQVGLLAKNHTINLKIFFPRLGRSDIIDLRPKDRSLSMCGLLNSEVELKETFERYGTLLAEML